MIPDLAAWGMAGGAVASVCAASAFVIKVAIGIGKYLRESEANAEMIRMIPGIRDQAILTNSIVGELSSRVAKHDSEIKDLHRKSSYAEGVDDGIRQSRGEYG